MGRTRLVATVLVLVAALAVAAVAGIGWWSGSRDEPQPPRAEATPVEPEPVPATVEPADQADPDEDDQDDGDDGCAEVDRPFAPRTISVPGVVARAAVVTPPRDANGVPGVPPLDAGGKSVFAWDREQRVRPGDPAGNVLINAHTWPDGSALGNRLLKGLRRGDTIVLHGGRARLCYRVTERVEVPADQPMHRYFDREGPPQVAIVVCSGRRLGPGLWEKRTVWFASPGG